MLRTHRYTTIVLPTQNGATYRIRKPGTPEECQKAIQRTLIIDYTKLPCTRTPHTPSAVKNAVPIGS